MTRLHMVLLIFMCIGAKVLQSGAETLLATEGDLVTLPCSLSGTFTYPEWRGPPSLFIYTVQDSPILNPIVTASARLSYADNNKDLLLANAVVADSGEYKCSYVGIGEHTFNLNVSEKTSAVNAENVEFISKSSYFERTVNTSIDPVTCTANCNPSCSFMWTKIGKGTVTVVSNTSVLSLGRLSTSNSGIYRCTATTLNGTALTKDLTITVTSDGCQANPCVHGSCFSKNSLFVCVCTKGYTGNLCENRVDPCEPNPCQHGTCFSHDLLFLCQCFKGYNGKTCDKRVDPCRQIPCVHGTCFSRESEFLCKCQSGYAGERCDRIDDQNPTIIENEPELG